MNLELKQEAVRRMRMLKLLDNGRDCPVYDFIKTNRMITTACDCSVFVLITQLTGFHNKLLMVALYIKQYQAVAFVFRNTVLDIEIASLVTTFSILLDKWQWLEIFTGFRYLVFD